jgi:Resolvase, N terminal domain/Recombinase
LTARPMEAIICKELAEKEFRSSMVRNQMSRYRTRYAARKEFVADGMSAVAYRGWPSGGNRDAGGPAPTANASPREGEEHLAAQKNAIRVFCRERRLYIWRTFSDRPGRAEHGNRPQTQLARMLVEMERRQIRTVVVHRADCLCHDPLTRAQLLVYLRSRGATVIEATSGQELTCGTGPDPLADGAAREGLARGQEPLTVLKSRVTPLENKSRAGRPPFGSLPGEKAIVDRLIELCKILPRSLRKGGGRRGGSRMSYRSVADELNDEGSRTPSGSPWTGAAVRNIIRRERPGWLSN